MLRYITVFIASFVLSLLLLSIEWFTWQACLFVAFYMTIQYWYQICRSQDLYKTNENLGSKIDNIKPSLVRINTSIDNLNGLILSKVEKIRKILIHESK